MRKHALGFGMPTVHEIGWLAVHRTPGRRAAKPAAPLTAARPHLAGGAGHHQTQRPRPRLAGGVALLALPHSLQEAADARAEDARRWVAVPEGLQRGREEVHRQDSLQQQAALREGAVVRQLQGRAAARLAG